MYSGSSVALVTPFDDSGNIDYHCLGKLIEWHIQSNTQAIVFAGTTGESPTLSLTEKVELAEFAVKKANGRIKVIFGNGSNCTRSSIELTQRLNGTGIDGYLTVTPYYNKPTQDGLLAHFSAIAQATELPIILYNVPGRTGCDMSIEVTAKLSELTNIIGIKDATGEIERVALLQKHCVDGFKLYSGDDASGLNFCLAGGDGVISVTANLVPAIMADIFQQVKNNNIEQAKALDGKLAQLHIDLFIEANPITVKWAMYKQQLLNNADLRLPLTILSDVGQQKIAQTMANSGLFSQEF